MKRVTEMFNIGSTAGQNFHTENVEAKRRWSTMRCSAIFPGRRSRQGFLVAVHRRRAAAWSISLARLHFDKDERLAIPADQIDFAAYSFRPIITRHHHESMIAKVPVRRLFPFPARARRGRHLLPLENGGGRALNQLSPNSEP